MRCLVLGGKGFLGSHLVDALVSRGHAVRVLDRANLAPLCSEAARAQVEWLDGDFTSEADVRAAVASRELVFHLVSTTLPQSSNADPLFDIETNLMASVRLLGHAVEVGVKRLVFISSGGTVYGIPRYLPIDEAHPTNPTCAYGIVKLAIEKYLGLYRQLRGLDYVVLRLSNPFGERQRAQASQGAVAVFLAKVLRGETVEIWGDGSVVRDYVYVGDAVAAMLAAIEHRGDSPVFNIGSGVGLCVNEVLDGIERVTGRRAKRVYTTGRDFDVPKSILAIDHAKRALGWAPTTPFLEGLGRTAGWMERALRLPSA